MPNGGIRFMNDEIGGWINGKADAKKFPVRMSGTRNYI
jgi:hypothetical protein